MKAIVVERQQDAFWKVWVKDEPGVWARGLTMYEAIGDLVISHANHFELKIETSPNSFPPSLTANR